MIEKNEDIKFWEFWESHSGGLYKICLRTMGGNDMAAEDALSEAMMRAREKMVTVIQDIENPKAWLSRLTKNICIDLLRKDRNIEFGDAALDAYEPAVPEERLECREAFQSLLTAIQQLSPHLKEAAMLRILTRKTYRDIANRLHISCANARKRAQTARAILRDKLRTFSGDTLCFRQLEWDEIGQFLETETGPQKPEIDMRFAYPDIANLMLEGLVRTVPVFLKRQSPRQSTREQTLLDYIARHPGGWKKRIELAEILYSQGEWNKSIRQLEMVIQKNPHSIDTFLTLGQLLKDTGRCRQAASVYRKASSYVHNQSSKRYLNGMRELCHSNRREGIRELNTAVKLEPKNTTFLNALALIHLEGDFTHQAAEFFERVLAVDSKNLVALTHIYEPLLAMGCMNKAEKAVDRLLYLCPGNAPALHRKILHACLKGYVCGEAGQHTRKLLKKLKRAAPTFHGTSEARAAYYFARGDQRKALGVLEDFCRAYPRCYDGLYNYSVWLFRCGNLDAAARIIARLVTVDEKNLRTLLTAGEIFGAAEDFKRLHRVTEAIERYHPDSWRGSCFRGLQLATRYYDLEAAEHYFHRAAGLQPAIPEIYVHLAICQMLLQKYSTALHSLKSGRSCIPDGDCQTRSTEIAFLTAEIFRRMDKRDHEHHWLTKALAQAGLLAKGQPAVGYYWQGIILRKMDDATACGEMFRLALRFAPCFPLGNEIKEISAQNRKTTLKSKNSQTRVMIRPTV